MCVINVKQLSRYHIWMQINHAATTLEEWRPLSLQGGCQRLLKGMSDWRGGKKVSKTEKFQGGDGVHDSGLQNVLELLKAQIDELHSDKSRGGSSATWTFGFRRISWEAELYLPLACPNTPSKLSCLMLAGQRLKIVISFDESEQMTATDEYCFSSTDSTGSMKRVCWARTMTCLFGKISTSLSHNDVFVWCRYSLCPHLQEALFRYCPQVPSSLNLFWEKHTGGWGGGGEGHTRLYLPLVKSKTVRQKCWSKKITNGWKLQFSLSPLTFN